jgi:hypothetical protein
LERIAYSTGRVGRLFSRVLEPGKLLSVNSLPVRSLDGYSSVSTGMWIQQTSPNLLKNDNHLEKFKVEYISGRLFLIKAGQEDFFKNQCNLPAGPSAELADLAREIARREMSHN